MGSSQILQQSRRRSAITPKAERDDEIEHSATRPARKTPPTARADNDGAWVVVVVARAAEPSPRAPLLGYGVRKP
jgi:hypothetical protein